jgi:hypothetical protein
LTSGKLFYIIVEKIMKLSYLGVTNKQFIIYLSSIEVNLIELIKYFENVDCVELCFDGKVEISIKNYNILAIELIKLIKNNNQIVEFNLIFDKSILMKNVWWDDLYIEGTIVKLDNIIDYLNKNKLLSDTQIAQLLNNINSFESKKFSTKKFSTYIQDSDRYETMLNL